MKDDQETGQILLRKLNVEHIFSDSNTNRLSAQWKKTKSLFFHPVRLNCCTLLVV